MEPLNSRPEKRSCGSPAGEWDCGGNGHALRGGLDPDCSVLPAGLYDPILNRQIRKGFKIPIGRQHDELMLSQTVAIEHVGWHYASPICRRTWSLAWL